MINYILNNRTISFEELKSFYPSEVVEEALKQKTDLEKYVILFVSTTIFGKTLSELPFGILSIWEERSFKDTNDFQALIDSHDLLWDIKGKYFNLFTQNQPLLGTPRTIALPLDMRPGTAKVACILDYEARGRLGMSKFVYNFGTTVYDATDIYCKLCLGWQAVDGTRDKIFTLTSPGGDIDLRLSQDPLVKKYISYVKSLKRENCSEREVLLWFILHGHTV